MKKLLITGSNGFVAGSIIRQAGTQWDLHGFARDGVALTGSRLTHHQVNLADFAAVERAFLALRPDAVIHTAAIANIDYCEQHQAEAKAINTDLTQMMADCCGASGARLVHCSTDTVFDGTKGFYAEDDKPNPVNFYAETKVRAEEMILRASTQHVVARLALVIGLRSSQRGNSFLSDLIAQWNSGATVHFAINEIRTPVDVITLGVALLELAGRPELNGCIHLAGNTRIDRYAMACRIGELLSVPMGQIGQTSSKGIPGRAPRPEDASLNNDKARQSLKTPMLSLTEALNGIFNNK